MCVFKIYKGLLVIICLYIGDMLIFSTNIYGIKKIQMYLTCIFQMKDLNEIDTNRGTKVTRKSIRFVLNQTDHK